MLHPHAPWHGWKFDLRTGKSRVGHGAAVVEGPYVAETFEVTVDDHHVLIEA